MLIDWKNTRINISSFGKYQWRKNVTSDRSWTGYVTDNHIWLPYCGKGQINTHHGKKDALKGTLFWFKPGFCYRATQDPKDPLGIYGVHFDLINENGRLLDQKIALPPEYLTDIDYKYLNTLFEKLVTTGFQIKTREKSEGAIMSENDYRHEKSINILKLILIKIDETASKQNQQQNDDLSWDDPVTHMAYKIQHDPTYRPEINKIAKEMGISPSSFSQLYKRRFHKSPTTSSIHWRLVHATRLLNETSLSIKEIASLVGYKSLHLFGRQFKKKTGVTPLQYRKNKNDENS